MGEKRRISRFLLRKGETRDRIQYYADNIGNEYDYQWVANLSSFYNVITGCMRNGFPMYFRFLKYPAWAFYPFIFIKEGHKMTFQQLMTSYTHERVHIKQQLDIHKLFSAPLIAYAIYKELVTDTLQWWIILIPFLPTLFYGLDMLRTWVVMKIKKRPVTFQTVRENTAFEREAISNSMNEMYPIQRKFFGVIAYMGIKLFQGYGQPKPQNKKRK